MLRGKRVHRNYKSAYEKAELVSEALRKRVLRGKTLKLGEFHGDPSHLPGDSGIVVPNGSEEEARARRGSAVQRPH